MKYADVNYKDGNRICGTIYWGITDPDKAKELFRQEFPEKANKDLTVKIYK